MVAPGGRMILAGDVVVAECPRYKPNWIGPVPDARLIAAAPELLAAVEKLLGQRDRPHGFADNDWYEPAFDQARLALAKARGEG